MIQPVQQTEIRPCDETQTGTPPKNTTKNLYCILIYELIVMYAACLHSFDRFIIVYQYFIIVLFPSEKGGKHHRNAEERETKWDKFQVSPAIESHSKVKAPHDHLQTQLGHQERPLPGRTP